MPGTRRLAMCLGLLLVVSGCGSVSRRYEFRDVNRVAVSFTTESGQELPALPGDPSVQTATVGGVLVTRAGDGIDCGSTPWILDIGGVAGLVGGWYLMSWERDETRYSGY
jgi:hypothetical protein